MANPTNALVPVAELLTAALFAALAVVALAWAAPRLPEENTVGTKADGERAVVSDRGAPVSPTLHDFVRDSLVR